MPGTAELHMSKTIEFGIDTFGDITNDDQGALQTRFAMQAVGIYEDTHYGGPNSHERWESLGLRPGKMHATAAGVAETGGGALLVLGAATPLAAAAITGTMTVAIEKVHAPKGPWNSDGGYEYPAVLIASVFAITAAGPGALSVDRRTWGTAWALAQLAAGVGGALAMTRLGVTNPQPENASERFTREPVSESIAH